MFTHVCRIDVVIPRGDKYQWAVQSFHSWSYFPVVDVVPSKRFAAYWGGSQHGVPQDPQSMLTHYEGMMGLLLSVSPIGLRQDPTPPRKRTLDLNKFQSVFSPKSISFWGTRITIRGDSRLPKSKKTLFTPKPPFHQIIRFRVSSPEPT